MDKKIDSSSTSKNCTIGCRHQSLAVAVFSKMVKLRGEDALKARTKTSKASKVRTKASKGEDEGFKGFEGRMKGGRASKAKATRT